jgi:hypothetical protein
MRVERRPERFARAVVALSIAALTAGPARATPPAAQDGSAASEAACVVAYTDAQLLRQNGALRAAREKLLVCGRAPCAPLLQKDCADWLDQVARALPSVVFDIREAGGEPLSEVRVSVDGAVLVERLTGRSIEVDPGEHVFQVEVPGRAPVARRVLVNEGDKSRRLAFVIDAAAATRPARTASGWPLWPSAALGVVGVVAAASFVYFGAEGISDRDDLSGCKGHCTSSQVDAMNTKFDVADVSLAVSALTLGLAAYLFLSRPAAPAPSPSSWSLPSSRLALEAWPSLAF